jgi:uncharacterized protein (DUF433 family)
VSIELTYPHIEKEEGQSACLHRIPRVRVAQIAMDYLGYGWSVDEMCRHHPYLTPAEAHAAMAYYFDHQAEIEAEIAAEVKEVDEAIARSSPSPLVLRLKAKGLL